MFNVWNKSTECVNNSVNMFKNRIDKYLVKAGGSTHRIWAGYT